jgi:protein-L-isoaspartate O-methyltransferase
MESYAFIEVALNPGAVHRNRYPLLLLVIGSGVGFESAVLAVSCSQKVSVNVKTSMKRKAVV